MVTQDLSFDRPQKVARTDLLCIGVRVKELESSTPASSMQIMKYSEYSYGLHNLVMGVISINCDHHYQYRKMLCHKGLVKLDSRVF